MFKIIELKKGEFLHEAAGDKIATTEKELQIYEVLILHGKYYTVVSKREDKIGVREFTPLNKRNMEYQDYITCPYCGHKDNDSWEKNSCGETQCGNCGSELKFETEVTVAYHIELKSKPNVVNLDK